MVAVPPLVTGRTAIDSIGDIYQYVPPNLVPATPPPAPPLIVGRVATDSTDTVFEYVPPNMVQRSGTVSPPVNTSPPFISIVSGGPVVGSQCVRTNPGTWIPPGPYTNQWQSGGVNIPGATGLGYIIQASDVGKLITIIVTVTNEGGSLSATSNALGPITGTAVFDPLSLFTGSTVGAYYRDSGNSANTPALWKDISGGGNDATQTTAANQLIKTTGYKDLPCYRTANLLVSSSSGFNLPAGFPINRQNYAWWIIFRMRSVHSRTFFQLGQSLLDGYTDISNSSNTALGPWIFRTAGGTLQSATVSGGLSNVAILIMSSSGTGVTLRLNGQQYNFSAYDAGSIAGGQLFFGNNAFINGEVYEFGVINRPLTGGEITNIESYFTSMMNSLPAHGLTVIDGDSLTEGWHAEIGMGWPTELDNDLGSTWKQISLGIAGRTANQMSADIVYTKNLYDSGFAKKIYVIFAGTNDLGDGNLSEAQTWTALQNCTQTMLAAGFQTIMCTVVPRGLGSPNWNSTKEAARLSLNSSILAAGPSITTTTCNFAGIPELQDPTNPTYFDTDQLHLLDPSFTLLKNAIRPVILGL